ncbi:hypothetical protein D3C86_1983250 [compost metagenome]
MVVDDGAVGVVRVRLPGGSYGEIAIGCLGVDAVAAQASFFQHPQATLVQIELRAADGLGKRFERENDRLGVAHARFQR